MIRLVTFEQIEFEAGEEVVLETTLRTSPKIKGTTQQFWVDQKILVITTRIPEYHYADTLSLSGILEERVLGKKDPILTAYFPEIELKEKDKNPFLSLTSFIRQHLVATISSTLPHTSSSLLLGVLIGLKEDFPSTFLEALRTTGTLHVVAASGMNVAIIGSILLSLTTAFLRRQVALIVCLLGIGLYAGIAGFEPSIVRASLMGSLVFTAQALGRQALALYVLALVAFGMLLFDPGLLSDIGFQLSFLATLGLLTIKPPLDLTIGQAQGPASLLKESFTTTVSAQITTIPVILANFGTFSLFSVLANTLVLWTVQEIMVIGGLAALTSFIFPPVGQILLFATLPFLLFFEAGVTFFASLPGQLAIEEFPLILGVGYYLLLLSILLLTKERKK